MTATLTVTRSTKPVQSTRFLQAFELEVQHWNRGRLIQEMVKITPKISDDTTPRIEWDTLVAKFGIMSDRLNTLPKPGRK